MTDQAVAETVHALERMSHEAQQQEARAEAAEADVRRLLMQRAAVLTVTEAHTGQHMWECPCCSRIEAILRGES